MNRFELYLATIRKYKFLIFVVSLLVTVLTAVYTVTIPNSYKASIIMIPSENDKLGLDFDMNYDLVFSEFTNTKYNMPYADIYYKLAFYDDTVMREFIDKYNIAEERRGDEKNYVFAFGYRGLYDFRKKFKDYFKEDKQDGSGKKNISYYNLMVQFRSKFKFRRDNKTSKLLITFENSDRKYAVKTLKNMVIFLSDKLKDRELKILENKMWSYKKLYDQEQDLEVRKQISNMIFSLEQVSIVKKVQKYYKMDIIVPPVVVDSKNKVAPVRGRLVIFSFIVTVLFTILLLYHFRAIRKD